MPKIGMEPIRRAETINAALECIGEVGIDHITLEMVAEKAGFSKGIVAYYFKTKQQLIVESLKAFLGAYQLKIISSLREDMTPIQMMQSVIDTSLPALTEATDETLNVSTLNGPDQIRLPEKKINLIFIQFISKAATDPELTGIMQKAYESDVEGISSLMRLLPASVNDKDAAYALLAMIYGLSFFRITQFLPAGKDDNRHIAYDFVQLLMNPSKTQGEKP